MNVVSFDQINALRTFVEITASGLGMSNQVTLHVVPKSEDQKCDTVAKVILLGDKVLSNYGRLDSPFEWFLDSMPNDPRLLTEFFRSLTPSEIQTIRNYFSNKQSTFEIESAILHELGHIYFQDVLPSHRQELRADRFSCLTVRGLIGSLRYFKRRLIENLLVESRNGKPRWKNVSYKCHPSDRTRLQQAFEIYSVVSA